MLFIFTLIKMTSFKIIIFFLLFCSCLLYPSSQTVSESETNFSYLKLNTDIHFLNDNFLYTDSLSQRRLTSYKNLNFPDINFEGIPLYSNFDGNYNLNFFHSKFLKSIFENQHSKSTNLNKNNEINDTISTVLQLFSGSKNGKFDINHIGAKNHFFWEVNPVFESSSGYSFSNKNTKNPFDLIKLYNSGYQNISIYTNTGFRNDQAKISLDGYFSNADLYVPNRINENHITYHFNDYNMFFGKFNFSDKFSQNLSISGNVFYKYAYKNESAQYDSMNVKIKSTFLDLSEYLYGANFLVEFPTFFEQNTEFSISYSQGLDINYDLKSQANMRIEDENLIFTIYQNIYKSPKFISNIEFQYFQKNINLSELGDIPNNKKGWNLNFDNSYKLSDDRSFSLQIDKFSNIPFNSQYFDIYPKQIGNPNLQLENNYLIELSYNQKITNSLIANLGMNYSRTDNLICNIPLAQDTFQFQNYYSKDNFALKLHLNYANRNISLGSDIEYVYSKFRNEIQKIQPNIIYPPFNFQFNGQYQFDFSLIVKLNFVYYAGVNSYNSGNQSIQAVSNVFLTNIYFEQVFDKDRIYFIINNLTNEIYYNYFNLPNSGINFLMGVLLTF